MLKVNFADYFTPCDGNAMNVMTRIDEMFNTEMPVELVFQNKEEFETFMQVCNLQYISNLSAELCNRILHNKK